jgi:hypothetical protein
MVFTAIGALADGAQELWEYNRDNFLYDRTMRQETEIKVAEWRAEQGGQWREDVRDLTGLTEKKMDKFLVVNTLQLGMCVALFAEGRLQPGTPHWLLHLYMVSLSSAFMYLLMSVWLSMHACVVAACEKARLVTQSVRLRVPTWQQFEQMRTAAASFEMQDKMMRIPFWDTAWAGGHPAHNDTSDPNKPAPMQQPESAENDWQKSMPKNASGSRQLGLQFGNGAPEKKTDTWGLESQPEPEYMPELNEVTLDQNPHLQLIRRAQAHYQSHDAYARVSMAFGTNQLLFSITYFCLGYVSVGDGAPWPALCIAAILVSLAVVLVELDISQKKHEKVCGVVLMTAGPLCASLSVIAWCSRPRWELPPELLLPLAYVSHGMWLLFALRACEVTLSKETGEMLPKKFRMIMYLDVFGWIKKAQLRTNAPKTDSKSDSDYTKMEQVGKQTYSPSHTPPCAQEASDSSQTATEEEESRRSTLAADIHTALVSWQSRSRQQNIDQHTKTRMELLEKRLHAATSNQHPPIHIPDVILPEDTTEHPAGEELPGMSDAEDLIAPACVASCADGMPCEIELARADKMQYFTDMGTEVVYSFDPSSGKMIYNSRPASRSESFASQLSVRIPASKRIHSDDLRAAEENMDVLESLCKQAAKPVEREDSLISERSVALSLAGKSDVSVASEEPAFLPKRQVTGAEILASASKKFNNLRVKTAHFGAQAVPWLLADEDETEDDKDNIGSANSDNDSKAASDPAQAVVAATQDDKMPWKVFRYGTLMLVSLWLFSPLMLYGVVGNVTEFGPKRISDLAGHGHTSFAEQEDPDGTFSGMMDSKYMGSDLEPSDEEFHSLPMLPAGEIVNVEWPRAWTTFTPRSLTCDEFGKYVVVSDDFSLYVGRLVLLGGQASIQAEGPFEPRDTSSKTKSRSLRGVGDQDISGSFSLVPHCTALEGQDLKDIGVVCSDRERCRVLVLHTNGERLTECPLDVSPSQLLNSTSTRSWPVVKPINEWKIEGSWLDPNQETVESLAVNDECGEEHVNGEEFDTDRVGCVVVGTSSGRVVQLRSHVSKDDQLVPEWAVQERLGKVGQGALHVFPGGYVMMLRPEIGLMQAYEVHKGSVLGQWRLPDTVEWQTLTGGGDWLFMLGKERHQKSQEGDGEFKMWRFPLPESLKQVFGAQKLYDRRYDDRVYDPTR